MSAPVTPATNALLRALAPAGELRAAINLGNPVLAQRSSEGAGPAGLSGVSVDIAHGLARRLDLPLRLIPFDAAAKVVEAAAGGVWDVAFLAIDAKRLGQVRFTEPYVLIEASYLVRADSSFQSCADLDRSGVRIAVGRGAAYELVLSRSLQQARLVHSETSAGAVERFRQDGLEAAAGVVQPLRAYARLHPEFRVIDGQFAIIRQALAVPAGSAFAGAEAMAYLETFIDQLKTSGFIAAALARSRQDEVSVAPPSVPGVTGRIL